MKNIITFYDSETTGVPDWKIPSDDPSQPHLVELAAIFVDADTREEVGSFHTIISPDGWEIPQEVSDIHGITHDNALKVGQREDIAVISFIDLWNGYGRPTRVSHNKVFDQRILRIGAKRYMGETAIEAWADKDSHECTMKMYQKQFGGKYVKLIDAYKEATGKDLTDAHNAMADTRACKDVYFWLLDQQKQSTNNPFEMRA